MWSSIPFLTESVQKKKFPFPAWYPYDSTVSPWYELTYLYQALGIWYIAMSDVNINTLFFALLTYIVVQCDLLCDNCKNVTNGHFSSTQNIISCIKHHKKIVRYTVTNRSKRRKLTPLTSRFAKSSNEVFEMVILGQFVTSTAVIATTLFMLTLVS